MPEDRFELRNDPPRPTPWKPRVGPKDRQRMLLSGLDCLPGQLDLFEVDGEPDDDTLTQET